MSKREGLEVWEAPPANEDSARNAKSIRLLEYFDTTQYGVSCAEGSTNWQIFDEEGYEVFNLPDDPGDEMILRIITIQRRAFDKGIRLGEWRKANEIRRALNVAEIEGGPQ